MDLEWPQKRFVLTGWIELVVIASRTLFKRMVELQKRYVY